MADRTSDASPEAQVAVASFTPAQRIAELNKIDQCLSALLASASEAIGILANKRPDGQTVTSYGAQEQKFREASRTYFATLSSIEVGLKRQVYALEEAGLVQAGEDRDVKKARAVDDRIEGVAGGGPLDSSWLNAQADNGVEEKLERQILDEAKKFLLTERARE